MGIIEGSKKNIARVVSKDGVTLGTAFSVVPPDYLLTCWHVIENQSSLNIIFDESITPIPVEIVADLSNEEEDIAVLKASQQLSSFIILGGDWEVGDSTWSFGYQYQQLVASGYPVSGKISGSTKLTNNRQLIVVSGTDFQRGLSGAPLIDVERGCVIGVVNAFMGEKGIGFAIPISTAMKKWHKLSEFINRNGKEAIARVKTLFEILGYSLESHKQIGGGPNIDLYGEITVGFSTTRTVVSCIFSLGEIQKESIEEFAYRVCGPLYNQKLIESAFIVSVSNQPFAQQALEFTKSMGIRAVTYQELEYNLINFSRYVSEFIDDFENHDQVSRSRESIIIDQPQWQDLFKYYVNLRCKEIVLNKKEIFDVDEYLNLWLSDKTKRHLSILGDYGTGKTSFCLHLIYNLAKIYQVKPSETRIPLFFSLRDCSPFVPIRTFILDKLSQYHIVVNDYQAFEKMVFGGRLLLIFDGFDELAENTDEQTALKRFRELNSLAKGQSKIILTCRTHYFKSEELSIDLLVPETLTLFMRELAPREDYSMIEIQEFDETQIIEFISKRTEDPQTYWNDIKAIYNLADLATRPILLTMILQTLPQLKTVRGKVDSTSLYSFYTKYWLEREKWRSVLTTEDKYRFAEQLAWQMFLRSNLSIHYDELLIQIESYFGNRFTIDQIAHTLDKDIRTSSFLIRDSSGNYKFVHKSFMEYLVGRKLAREIEDSRIENLELRLIPHTILVFLKDLISPSGIKKIKEVAIQNNLYSTETRGICMDILLLLGEVINEVPWIFSLSFSPDGTHIATGNADCKLRIWDINSIEQPMVTISSHKSWIRTVHYSQKGNLLASSGWDGSVKIWHTEDFSEAHSIQLGDKVVSVRFSPDGSLLAAGGFDKTVHIWNTNTWQLICSLKGHYGVVWDVCFNPDSEVIASASTDSLVRLWSTRTGELIGILRGHKDGVSSICFSNDGKSLFSGDWQGEIIAWDWKIFKIKYRIQAHSNMIGELDINQNSSYLASCGDDLKVKVRSCDSGELIHVFSDPTDFLPAIQFSPNGQKLACGGYDKVLRIWDTQNWSLQTEINQK